MQRGAERDRCQRQARAAQTAEHDEDHHGNPQVEQQAGDEQRERRIGQPGRRHDLIGDATENAHRRKAAALGAMNHHQPHQHRVDAVLHGEVQRNRRQDRGHRRAQRAETGQQCRHHEHHPGDPGDASTHHQHRPLDQPVDGAVVLRDAEQIGDPDQRQEQVTGKPGKDRRRGHFQYHRTDDKGRRKGQRTHVDGQHAGDAEDDHQHQNRQKLIIHCNLTPRSRTAPQVPPLLLFFRDVALPHACSSDRRTPPAGARQRLPGLRQSRRFHRLVGAVRQSVPSPAPASVAGLQGCAAVP